ncbi:MAG: hypothetical protein ABIZ05_01120 [Pseudonocardiaceae bacterium]
MTLSICIAVRIEITSFSGTKMALITRIGVTSERGVERTRTNP